MQKRRGRDHIDCGRPWRLIDIALIMHDNTGPEPPKAGRVGLTAQMTLMPHLHVCQPPASPSLRTHTRTPFAAHQYGVRRSVRLLNEDWARAEQVKIIRDANECEIAFYDSLYALLPLNAPPLHLQHLWPAAGRLSLVMTRSRWRRCCAKPPQLRWLADRPALRPRLCRSAGKKFENTEMFGQYPLQVNGFKDLHECLEAAMIEGEIESLHSAENSARSGQEVSA